MLIVGRLFDGYVEFQNKLKCNHNEKKASDEEANWR